MDTTYYIPPRPEDLPDILLYMDQMVEFVTDRMKIFEETSKKALLTKTMVNNYVKSGILDKPMRKRYSKDQVMKLFLICHLKSVLTMEDIGAFSQQAKKYDSPEAFYREYRSLCLEFQKSNSRDGKKQDESGERALYHAIASEWHWRRTKDLLQTDSR